MATASPQPCDSPPRRPSAGMRARPFSASDGRRAALMEVLVLGGENLVARERQQPMSSYVTCRVAEAPERGEATAPRLDVAWSRDECEDSATVYDLHSSPFAVTRVAEHSAAPLWNELLLLPVDAERHASEDALSLVVDVVQRDASQQEDSLVATASIPLRYRQSPQPLVLEFPPFPAADSPPIRVYLQLNAFSPATQTPAAWVCEAVVEALSMASPAAVGERDRCMVCVSLGEPSRVVADVRDLFETVRDGGIHSGRDADVNAALTPAALLQGGQCQWKFPLVWHHSSPAPSELHVSCLRLADQSLVGSSQLVASGSVSMREIADNGAAARLSVALRSPSDAGDTVGHVTLVLRAWSLQAWLRFQELRATRRVVCTNRRDRRRAELLALEWTSAICRGLNRYPLSSFYDAGGLSSMLAEYLAASIPATATAPDESTHAKSPSTEKTASDATQMLKEHIRLLQQEVVSKQQSIAKLQADVEERTNALRTCGLELLSTRKELRARDNHIAQLKVTIDEMRQREEEQLKELTAEPDMGAPMDNRTSQRLSLLAFKYKELDRKHREAQTALSEAQRVEKGYTQLEEQEKTAS
ncbi:hypothetical protein P43SY_001709 [Pythium insidiosum]|uniref:C2 domain-containing protein n=1 Tax=Pythium insidiosum TaxID=114742 RepID=A0AAD5M3Q3_PYTIN|nr:hypothetical protein P43SY_001709 [Pythium insidiosum]